MTIRFTLLQCIPLINSLTVTFMDIHCKRCNEPIPAENVHLDNHMAKCSHCDAVFDFRDQVTRVEAHQRSVLQAPKGIELQTTMDGLEIVRRWFSKKTIGLLIFCLFWDGFMVVWFGIAISQKQWAMAAFGSIHGAVGLGLSYLCVAGFVNRTYIKISFKDISISHRPLPWFGGKSVPLGEVKQIFTKEKIHRNKNGTSYSYEVHFQDHERNETKMVSGLENPEQALYIEQEIEATMGIKDAPVAGELPRR